MAEGLWWLASYPKSGNTWLRAFLASLVSGQPADINAMGFLGGIASSRSALDDFLGLDSGDLSLDRQADLRPRLYEDWATVKDRAYYGKVHDAYLPTPSGEPMFPPAATSGAVYVLRDPRAVAVSLAHHMGCTVDRAIDQMNDSAGALAADTDRLPFQLRQCLGSWSGHADSWLSAPFPVHLMRYEDMSADPHNAFGEAAVFLGLPSDKTSIAAAVEASSFSRLKQLEQAGGFKERSARSEAFFREGQIDGWCRALTPGQIERIVSAQGAAMRRFGYL